MAVEAFCPVCTRVAYIGDGDDLTCPVCSSSLNPVHRGPDVPEPGRGAEVPDEEERLTAVRRYDILDSPPDGAFDRVASLAARIIGTPIATITIVDRDRIWFKSAHGLDVREIPREEGLCASAVMQYDPWTVNDAAVDPRTLENSLVRGTLGLRFYVGIPLTTSDGYNLGTLNVIDKKPRKVSAQDLAMLEDLAAIVVDELELRLAARRLFARLKSGAGQHA